MKKEILLSFISYITLVISSQAAITVTLHETFDDNTTPGTFFVQAGTPTYSGGQLELNNSTWLSGSSGLGAINDNFGLEIIGTFSAFESFDFLATLTSNSFPFNQGIGILAQFGQFQAVTSAVGSFGYTHQDTSEYYFAIVRDQGVNKFYIDNLLMGQATQDFMGTAATLNLGAHPLDAPNGLLNGSINEVRTFSFIGGEFQEFEDLLRRPPLSTPESPPEPSSALLLAIGSFAVILKRRK